MRKPVIAGNWKMFKDQAQTRAYFAALAPLVVNASHCEIMIAPSYTSLSTAVEAARGTSISIAAQNMYFEAEGAYTGEVSAGMLLDAGCTAVLVGHSERRQLFGETDDTAHRKVKAALAARLTPVLCVGETLTERESGHTEQVLERQVRKGLAALTGPEFSRIIFAYEPVWAIGTGRTATPKMASEAHGLLRRYMAEIFSSELAAGARILYGGSVKPDNIAGLMAEDGIDGALVGGASLDPKSFAAIVNYSNSNA